MSRQTTPIQKPEIVLDQNAAMPLYRQLYERLRSAILERRLEAGARLPSTRVLASELGISRNTTALAYEQLLMEGYIESRVGDGTRVAYLLPEPPVRVAENVGDQDVAEVSALARRSQLLVRIASLDDLDINQTGFDARLFRLGQPDVEHFPYETWARLVARHVRQSLQAVSFYQNAQGYGPLREAIAAHVGIRRGVHCLPEQVIITAGAQGALDLVARVLLDPGDQAWVEDPGYLGARGSLLAAGVGLISVPVDREGIDVRAGRKLCGDARLAIVTPSHQFPTGVTMSLNRRLELLQWAREASAWIVEDDYDSEYRFSGRPLEALQGLDSAGHVLYIGTFSKALFPSLRLGYLIVPSKLLKGFLAMRRFTDVHPPILEQMTLADFIDEGHYMRYLRKMRLLYLERRNTLADALKRELRDLLDVAVPEAGIHLVAWLPEGTNARAIVQQAAVDGLAIQLISHFSLQPPYRDGLLLGFASASPAELDAGVKRLAAVLRKFL
jgi:GntR family transcriptional regulator/MocR family aminotransferase